MELENGTPFVARLLRLRLTNDDVQATLVVKSTFERDAEGRWEPAAEQVGIIDERLETPYGVFHNEKFVRKDGVDVCILGTARPGRPVRELRLEVSVGAHRRALHVFGDREWQPRASGLAPSDPAPFEEMPIGYTRAYGGITEHDCETLAWTDNPVGRGYYLSEEAAVGGPLPNIEPGDGPLVAQWSDQPPIAGWGPYPNFWGIRAREGLDLSAVNAERPFPRVKARLNNNAHSSLIFESLDDATPIILRGTRPEPAEFRPPPFRPTAEVCVGNRTWQAEGRLDGVLLWLDAGRITLTHRVQFSYRFERGERRVVRLGRR
jgi:hypothetical protein